MEPIDRRQTASDIPSYPHFFPQYIPNLHQFTPARTQEPNDFGSPHTHPYARVKMNNLDPTNEFIYQVPGMGMGMRKSMSEGGLAEDMRQTQSLDPRELTERLATLGLAPGSFESLGIHSDEQEPAYSQQHQQFTPSQQAVPALGSAFQQEHPLPSNPYGYAGHPHHYPSITELGPGDSISMYRPQRGPVDSIQSTRRGGTNIDPGEAEELVTPEDGMFPDDRQMQDQASYWTQDNVTQASPRTGEGNFDQMTIGPTTVYTRGDIGRTMSEMRDRLELAEHERNQEQMVELNRQLREARDLATTATRLEQAEKQLRELQARLIAEQVARTQIEKEAQSRSEDMHNYQNEWASAVRALRRARDEGKKTDEEKRRIQRCFEEARDKLWKYHEALRVREARAQGKEEGRAEAWQEAERWMGGSPPIPNVDPIQSVPGAVLHQTPMLNPQALQYLQSPNIQPGQQQQQAGPQQHSYTSPQQQSQLPQAQQQQQQQIPLESIQQVMEIFAQNPDAFSQFTAQHFQAKQQQNSGNPNVSPEQQARQPTRPPSAALHSHQQTPSTMSQQTGGQGQAQPTAPAMWSQQTGQQSLPFMMAQQTGQQSMPGIIPQHNGVPTMPSMGQPPNVGQPVILPVAAMMPLAQPASMGMPPVRPMGLPSYLPQTQMPTQPATRAPTAAAQRTPRTQATSVHPTPQRPAPTSTRSQVTRLPQAPSQVAPSQSIGQPHAADSYLDRVEHDPSLQRMMSGVRSKTIHSSGVPPTEAATRAATQVPQTARSHYDDGASIYNKPLPNPSVQQSAANGASRAQTHKAPSSRAGTHLTENRPKVSRRLSLSEGLHTQPAMAQIPDGDRYPVFPTMGAKGHSRHSSFGSFDPAAIGLPPSRDISAMQSPDSEQRINRRPSARATPQRSRGPSRSHMASALRNDTDLDNGELPPLPEAPEEDIGHPEQLHSQNTGPPPSGYGGMPPGGRSMPPRQGPPRPAPSMPNMRHRITPRMPQPLGGGPPAGGHGRTFSEPHQNRPPQSLGALWATHPQDRDATARLNERLPEPESTYHPPKTHDIFVPPRLAPTAVSGGVEDVQGPRTSALGLYAMEGDGDIGSGGRGGGESGVGSGGGGMKAPTITIQPPSSRSRSNHPPTTIFPSLRSHSPKPQIQTATVPAPRTPKTNRTENTVLPGTKRQTIVVTERFNQHPQDIPLPAPRSIAPTAYTHSRGGSPPDAQSQSQPQAGPEVRSIDFAVGVPLPLSRTTTIFDRRTVVTTEPDIDAPRPPSQTKTNTNASRSKSHRKPVLANGATTAAASTYTNAHQRNTSYESGPDGGVGGTGIDPRMYPLPPSRATTHRGRASTYAGTVAPIEEVTEPESGRENTIRRR